MCAPSCPDASTKSATYGSPRMPGIVRPSLSSETAKRGRLFHHRLPFVGSIPLENDWHDKPLRVLVERFLGEEREICLLWVCVGQILELAFSLIYSDHDTAIGQPFSAANARVPPCC